MRLFFALRPDAAAAMAIADWRDRRLPLLPRPVPAANLHMTLQFLGDCEPRQVDRLMAGAGDLTPAAVDLVLDELGYWPGPDVLWLEPRNDVATPVLARALRGVAQRAGCRVERRGYQAHMTLCRHCPLPVHDIARPSFALQFAEFHLCESIRLRGGGVRYESLAAWPVA